MSKCTIIVRPILSGSILEAGFGEEVQPGVACTMTRAAFEVGRLLWAYFVKKLQKEAGWKSERH